MSALRFWDVGVPVLEFYKKIDAAKKLMYSGEIGLSFNLWRLAEIGLERDIVLSDFDGDRRREELVFWSEPKNNLVVRNQ